MWGTVRRRLSESDIKAACPIPLDQLSSNPVTKDQVSKWLRNLNYKKSNNLAKKKLLRFVNKKVGVSTQSSISTFNMSNTSLKINF